MNMQYYLINKHITYITELQHTSIYLPYNKVILEKLSRSKTISKKKLNKNDKLSHST